MNSRVSKPTGAQHTKCFAPDNRRRVFPLSRSAHYTPVNYVQCLRVEEAKQMLEQSADATEAIALSVGYQDPAFFRRLFKRQTGIMPAQYWQRFQVRAR